MEKKDKIVYYNGKKYIIINSIIYMENKYIFVINFENINDVKLLVCLNKLEEVDDIELIKNIILKMK